jgi:hypothetical protein
MVQRGLNVGYVMFNMRRVVELSGIMVTVLVDLARSLSRSLLKMGIAEDCGAKEFWSVYDARIYRTGVPLGRRWVTC